MKRFISVNKQKAKAVTFSIIMVALLAASTTFIGTSAAANDILNYSANQGETTVSSSDETPEKQELPTADETPESELETLSENSETFTEPNQETEAEADVNLTNGEGNDDELLKLIEEEQNAIVGGESAYVDPDSEDLIYGSFEECLNNVQPGGTVYIFAD